MMINLRLQATITPKIRATLQASEELTFNLYLSVYSVPKLTVVKR
ncbi:MAG: hypothetical protein ACTS78_03225 [Arsenophonus sp. NC-WZS1-MAG3]